MKNIIPGHAHSVVFKTVDVQGLQIFYREAGPSDAPVILFLHGFPSSSHMYRDILQHLASSYHVIAPDYPGFGLSSAPSTEAFEYSFDNIAAVMEAFIDRLGLHSFTLYMQDYGGPVGFRIISKRPGLVQALIIQNANAYVEGLGPYVQELGRLYESGDDKAIDAAIYHKLSLEGIREEYLHAVAYPERVSPDAYLSDHYFMERPGIKTIQYTLFKNYGTNFPLYPEWQQYLKTHQPPALIVWGKRDQIFTAPGAEAYLRDLETAELHLLDGGHFVLEEHHAAVAQLIQDFLQRRLK